MKVKRQALQPGWVLAKDVFVNTSRPIIRKQTVLTDEHLEVLKAFLIDEVAIEAKTEKGEYVQDLDIEETEPLSFIEQYLNTVNAYKGWFENWRNGAGIDPRDIRVQLIPLLEDAVERPDEVFSLHRYLQEEDYLFHHAVSTAVLSAFIGKKMSYPKGDWTQLGLAGALCDCGMAKIPPTVLKRPGAPTPYEREEIKKHPAYSFEMLKSVPALKEGVVLAASQHHEREDGSGYPLGIQGRKLHPFSKIVAVADSFHAMACSRPYKKGKPPFQVLDMMTKEPGRFDFSVVNVLARELVNFSAGSKVRLTNGELAEIVFIPPQTPGMPIVRMEKSGQVVALTDCSHLYVDTVLT